MSKISLKAVTMMMMMMMTMMTICKARICPCCNSMLIHKVSDLTLQHALSPYWPIMTLSQDTFSESQDTLSESQDTLSQPVLALKSPRMMSLSAFGTVAMTECRSLLPGWSWMEHRCWWWWHAFFFFLNWEGEFHGHEPIIHSLWKPS